MNLAALFGFNKEDPVITPLGEGRIRLDIKCVSCNEVKSVTTTSFAYEKYKAGAYIQDAFCNHSANERELVQSHMCGDCFDRCTKEPEEETEQDDGTHEDDARRSG